MRLALSTKEISRKGAKAQRRARKKHVAFTPLACFLCVFAPLREIYSLMLQVTNGDSPHKAQAAPLLSFSLPSQLLSQLA
jgi:hypothetical protein